MGLQLPVVGEASELERVTSAARKIQIILSISKKINKLD